MAPLPMVAALALALTATAAPAVAHGPDLPVRVRLFAPHVRPLAMIGGVKIIGEAYGSSFVVSPWSDHVFFGLTDRGPNVDGPNGTKVEPLPDFQPAIGEFGVEVLDGGGRLVISNDSDVGIDAVNETSAPFTLHAKSLPSGQQDDGELLEVTLPRGTDRS